MKTTFICVFILTIFPSVYAILCHCPQTFMRIKFSSSTVNEFKLSLRQNISGEEKDLCYLRTTMIYTTSTMQIGFTNAYEKINIVDGDTLLNVVIDKGTIPILEHACSTHDYCDIDFIFDHVQWFLDGKYQETLVQNSASLRARKGPQIGKEIIIKIM